MWFKVLTRDRQIADCVGGKVGDVAGLSKGKVGVQAC